MAAEDKARMAKSLAAYGDLSGIVVNRLTGQLIGGHQRADVLTGAEWHVDDLPTPEPDGTVGRGHLVHGGRRYAVRVVDWPERKAHAALLAANRFGRVGSDDPAMLKDLLQELDTGDMDMDLTGYSAAALELLMTQEHQEEGDSETKAPSSPRSVLTFPPRVWLTQRAAIVDDLQKIVDGYGGTAEWAE
jgi:hypothetical protein